MASLSQENIEWAEQSLRIGRPTDFVTSVLECSLRELKKALAARRNERRVFAKTEERAERYVWRASGSEATTTRQKAEKAFAALTGAETEELEREAPQYRGGRIKMEDEALERERRQIARRRFLLGLRHARHWDMIWFLTAQHMKGRTIRNIYGAECLIWARGGGIDVEI